MRPITPALALLVAAFGAAGPDSAAALERAPRGGNPAVLSLLEAAEQDLNAGKPAQAVVALERALRIEPRNPTLWHYLGLARFNQGSYLQAEAMAAKSHSLASADRSLRGRNAGLMAAAQEAAGKPVDVPSLESPVPAWERALGAVERARDYVDTRVRRERPAAREQRRRSVIVFDGREYRRLELNELPRARR
jgi:tetratricopeptide (TPR) repeat protein